jgi:hypothetical protein
MTKTEKALAKLNELIEAGREFPDVVHVVARSHGIKESTLTRAYDAQWD